MIVNYKIDWKKHPVHPLARIIRQSKSAAASFPTASKRNFRMHAPAKKKAPRHETYDSLTFDGEADQKKNPKSTGKKRHSISQAAATRSPGAAAARLAESRSKLYRL